MKFSLRSVWFDLAMTNMIRRACCLLLLICATAVRSQAANSPASLPSYLPPATFPLRSAGAAPVQSTINVDVLAEDGKSLRKEAVFGQLSTFTFDSSPARVKAYASALQAAGWEILATPVRGAPLTARYTDRFIERWVTLRSKRKSGTLQAVDQTFAGADLVFSEAATMEEMSAKFNGLFPLPAPELKDVRLDQVDDFPFLRHFPGFAQRVDLMRQTDSLKLSHAQVGATNVKDELVLNGKTVMKIYHQSGQGTSTFKQFMAYRLALMNAGWSIVDSDIGYLDDEPKLLANHEVGPDTLWARLVFGGHYEKFSVTLVAGHAK